MKKIFPLWLLAGSLVFAACERKAPTPQETPHSDLAPGSLGEAGAIGAAGGQSTTTQGMGADGKPVQGSETCPPGSTSAACAKEAPSGPPNEATKDRDHQQRK